MIDSDQHEEVIKEVRVVVNIVMESGFPPQYHDRLNKIVQDHMDEFSVGLSAVNGEKGAPM